MTTYTEGHEKLLEVLASAPEFEGWAFYRTHEVGAPLAMTVAVGKFQLLRARQDTHTEYADLVFYPLGGVELGGMFTVTGGYCGSVQLTAEQMLLISRTASGIRALTIRSCARCADCRYFLLDFRGSGACSAGSFWKGRKAKDKACSSFVAKEGIAEAIAERERQKGARR